MNRLESCCIFLRSFGEGVFWGRCGQLVGVGVSVGVGVCVGVGVGGSGGVFICGQRQSFGSKSYFPGGWP